MSDRDGAGTSGRVSAGTSDHDAAPAVVATVAVAAISIAASIALHPEWSPTGDALSDLGRVGVRHAWVFDAGMVASGALGLVAAARLAPGVGRWLAGAGFLALVGVGVFPMGTRLHAPAALAFFALQALALVVLGAERDDPWVAGAALAGVVAAVGASQVVAGLAIPETVAILGFALGYARLTGVVDVSR